MTYEERRQWIASYTSLSFIPGNQKRRLHYLQHVRSGARLNVPHIKDDTPYDDATMERAVIFENYLNDLEVRAQLVPAFVPNAVAYLEGKGVNKEWQKILLALSVSLLWLASISFSKSLATVVRSYLKQRSSFPTQA